MPTGTVTRFDKAKGLISSVDGGMDVFVHYSAIEGKGFRGLSDGAEVGFEL